jgi:hypothetical protein
VGPALEARSIQYTILRSTQFFDFLAQTVESGADGDTVRLSPGLMQLVAADDVAATVTDLAIGAPVGRPGRARRPRDDGRRDRGEGPATSLSRRFGKSVSGNKLVERVYGFDTGDAPGPALALGGCGA